MDAKTLLKTGADIATLTTAVVALALSLRQFNATVDRERETRAVDLFVKYNELMRDAGQTAAGNPRDRWWRSNLAIALAESIWRLRNDDSGWIATVKWMLKTEDSIKAVKDLDCSTYDPRFASLATGTLQHPVCAP